MRSLHFFPLAVFGSLGFDDGDAITSASFFGAVDSVVFSEESFISLPFSLLMRFVLSFSSVSSEEVVLLDCERNM